MYYYEYSYLYIDLTETPLAAGSYTLEFYPVWVGIELHDYSIVIDAPKDIQILDSQGRTSRLTAHDLSNKNLAPAVA